MNQLDSPVPQFPIAATPRAVMETFGFDTIMDMVVEGETVSKIARMLGVTAAALSHWLAQHPRKADFEEAKRRSAEILEDKNAEMLETLWEREDITGPMVGLAKLQSEHFKRMAGIRNARHRDKTAAEVVAPPPSAPAEIPRFYITIAPGLTATASSEPVDMPPPRVIAHEA